MVVSDTGHGMDQATQAHVFEPFFTTKKVGEGTGLGLATVYGIVRQNRGFISIDSEVGRGTSIALHLPAQPMQPSQDGSKEGEWRTTCLGRETVLLVEDEESVLDLASCILEDLGYTVLIASTPEEAFRLAKKHADEIHLLLTDVVMPEMNGRELAAELDSICPNLRCLFMSGYTADIIGKHGVLDEGVHFVQKPFAMKELALKVREALE